MTTKICNKCNKSLSIEQFGKYKNKYYRGACKACEVMISVNYCKLNREIIRSKTVMRHRKNFDIVSNLKSKIGKCNICNKFYLSDILQYDHLDRVSKKNDSKQCCSRIE